MSDFKREERYIVIKVKDLKYASAENKLLRVLQDAGIPTRRCVVVEADWPEYETVWKMIEARCSDRPSEIAALREQVEKLTKELSVLKTTPPHLRQDLHCVASDLSAQVRERDEQLTALAEQNEKLKAERSSVWMVANKVSMMLFATKEDAEQSQSQRGASTYILPVKVPVFGAQLPDLASPVLNRIRAEALDQAAKWFNDNVDNRTDTWQAQELRRMAAELEKTNG